MSTSEITNQIDLIVLKSLHLIVANKFSFHTSFSARNYVNNSSIYRLPKDNPNELNNFCATCALIPLEDIFSLLLLSFDKDFSSIFKTNFRVYHTFLSSELICNEILLKLILAYVINLVLTINKNLIVIKHVLPNLKITNLSFISNESEFKNAFDLGKSLIFDIIQTSVNPNLFDEHHDFCPLKSLFGVMSINYHYHILLRKYVLYYWVFGMALWLG
ncbi:hypothetical protein AGLY_008846 [Aphis glycines]|uniref:Uncharacterized protein n=1 Tax=Aphis glycines TaxID=307491 RepID=A0A6G0TJT8_APHGL|nr:hypothetical protein AGLY_008846 [Aphis glycines]